MRKVNGIPVNAFALSHFQNMHSDVVGGQMAHESYFV